MLGKLVVMIPAYNEGATIAEAIRRIPRRIAGIGKVEVLVIDDGSKDSTAKIARGAGADSVFRHGINRGLGTAFRNGLENALKMQADIIVNMDADLQFNPEDIPKLIAPILAEQADVVTCSRFKDAKLIPKMPFIKKIGNKFFTSLVSALAGQKFTDTQCGFRAYSREAALRAMLFGRFTYTQEVLLDLINKGFRIEEVACRVKGQREGKSRIVKHWYVYGIKAMIIIIRSLRDYKPLLFFGSSGIALFSIGVLSALLALKNLAIVLVILGVLLVALALIADMSDRQRKIQEEILYRLKKQELEN